MELRRAKDYGQHILAKEQAMQEDVERLNTWTSCKNNAVAANHVARLPRFSFTASAPFSPSSESPKRADEVPPSSDVEAEIEFDALNSFSAPRAVSPFLQF